MPNNVYSEINLHLTWHTKGSAPLIHDAVEHHLYQFLEQRVKQTPGTVCHAVGGTDDHVHLAVSVPPTVQVSDWVGQLKGASAHYLNQRIMNRSRFAWQAGYGVVSFGSKDLPWVTDYIRNQGERHATGKTHGRLERIDAATQARTAQADGRKTAKLNRPRVCCEAISDTSRGTTGLINLKPRKRD